MTVQFKANKGTRGIEWADATRNVTGGCEHACKWEMPDGTVAECYAKTVAEFLAVRAYPDGFETHYWRPHKLKELVKGDDPLLIFADSMSDLFGSWVPEEHTRTVLQAMADAPHHTYQLLTKAPGRLLKFTDEFPPNLWVGVSSPPDWFKGNRLEQRQQEIMLRKSLDVLRQVKEKTGNVVWLSAEPVSWDLADVIDENHPLDWVVIGAASSGRNYYQPAPWHIKRLLEVFDATNTPVFFKGNIKPTFEENDFGSDELNRWREDFPVITQGQVIPAVLRRQEMAREHGWALNAFLTPELENPEAKQATCRRDASGETRPALF